jgi:hypothetical protein
LETEATLGADDDQVTVDDTFSVAPVLNVPVAVSWTFVPAGVLAGDGESAIDSRTAAVTFSVVVPAFFVFGSVAVMRVLPGAPPVASPVLEIVPTVVVAEVHVTELVMSCVEWSV